jgi:hypothetical protein
MYGNFLLQPVILKTEMILLTLLFGKEVSKKTCETETHGSDEAIRSFRCGFGAVSLYRH